jgi:hypothetical protein
VIQNIAPAVRLAVVLAALVMLGIAVFYSKRGGISEAGAKEVAGPKRIGNVR